MLIPGTTRDRASRAAKRSAFTLLEILVVVAIIVVLAGLGVPYILSQMEGANEKIAKVKAGQIGEAVQMYYLNHDNSYPGSLQELTQPGSAPAGKTALAAENILDPWGKPYTMDVNGPNHQGSAPDIYTTSPSGKVIGNWGR
jgi:general secretion pathway protein G